MQQRQTEFYRCDQVAVWFSLESTVAVSEFTFGCGQPYELAFGLIIGFDNVHEFFDLHPIRTDVLN